MAALCLLLAFMGAGCLTLDQIAPPVSRVAPASEALPGGLGWQDLEEGRIIYLTDCAKCHNPEPIAKYSHAQWANLMPKMIRESRLDDQRAHQVTAYVDSVLAQTPR